MSMYSGQRRPVTLMIRKHFNPPRGTSIIGLHSRAAGTSIPNTCTPWSHRGPSPAISQTARGQHPLSSLCPSTIIPTFPLFYPIIPLTPRPSCFFPKITIFVFSRSLYTSLFDPYIRPPTANAKGFKTNFKTLITTTLYLWQKK